MTDKTVILNKALELGEQKGWENLRLADIANALGVSLADIHQHFSQKDDLVEAWFDRADQHLLSVKADKHWLAQTAEQRIEQVIWRWLASMAKNRRLTGQMLLYKLEPGHIHLQLGGLLRISRTVQWLMEAADLKARHLTRIRQEIILTTVFVSTFIHWLNDSSAEQRQSRHSLQRKLAVAAKLNTWK